MPIAARGGGSALPARSTNAIFGPRLGFVLPCARPGPASTASSTMVFHSPQLSHLPAHLPVTAPQDWQTKRATDFAILRIVRLMKEGSSFSEEKEAKRLLSVKEEQLEILNG
jgi:hypothetical protein